MRRLIIAGLCLLPMWAAQASAQDAIAPEMLQKLKRAAVFVKVSLGSQEGSGSGFVVKIEKESVYLITNEHVVAPPPVYPGEFRREPRGRNRDDSRTSQSSVRPDVAVVFNSGTKEEQALPAEIVAVDVQRDLALLKVSGVRKLPEPIAWETDYQPTETTPVFTLGFPFGENLSSTKGHPAISIGRGAISSLRLDEQGEDVIVQIDGALNPGNSGGAVVDAKGRLVGVAVATIRGSGIGFAIPPASLKKMLAGRVTQPQAVFREGKDDWMVDLSLSLVDPFGRLREVAVHCVPREVKPAPGESPRPLEGSHRVALVMANGKATGTWSIKKTADKPTVIALQPTFLDADGKTHFVVATNHRLSSSGAPFEPFPTAGQPGIRPRPFGLPNPDGQRPGAAPQATINRGFTQDVGDRKLSGGMFVLEKHSPSLGFGLVQTGEKTSRCTWFVIVRLPGGGFTRASFMARSKTAEQRTTYSCGAYLDDESLTVEHSYVKDKSPLAEERFTVLDEKYDAAAGRVFFIDARESPPRVTQKKFDLPLDHPVPPLDDGQVLEMGQKTLDDLLKRYEEVRAFVSEK